MASLVSANAHANSSQRIGKSTTITSPDIIRRSADFHPSIWGDHFLKYTPQFLEVDDNTKQEVQKLKEEVRRMLTAAATNPSQRLHLIDTIQRLGFAYHFESEISDILGKMKEMNPHNDLDNDNLHTVSLWFRLLRQEGHNISSDIFQKFTNKEGKFDDTLASDVEGILSLYEASHMRVHGEPMHEEAVVFSTTHLEASTEGSQLSSFLEAQVNHALRQPILKGLPRVENRRFISVYHQDPSHNDILLRFAKLDFNVVQKLHQNELNEISKWWKDLDFASKLPFARDRLVEGYIWPVGVYFEPKYSLARVILTKVIGVTTMIDDIYDVYGTLEELEVFTDAIEKWDTRCIDQLPEYMKYCYEALLKLYDEIEEELAKEGRAYRMPYAKETMKKLVQSYYVEAQWFHKNYTPTLKEYMEVALVSSTYYMLTVTSFLGMGDEVSAEVFDWLMNCPKIVTGSAVICRLMDDVVSHKFEQDRGHVDSSVECYMKEFNVTEEEACKELNKQVVNAWKDMKEECLEPRDVPMSVLTRVINLARVIDAVYKDGDGYTHAGGIMTTFVKSLFIQSVPVL
ncbi:(-)-germacrene D synthase-like [Humulus lupulus]|uniref:(-)-germacrene D synthase-like n=1 Tax=Humulus lupulus TaxID=3486 RepID=UPI002B40CCC6|nr:(-)-germacrene D synthase-like [Humulus lupulus]